MAKELPVTSLHKKAYGQWSGNEKGRQAVGGHNDPRSICKEFLNKVKIQ